MPEPDTIPPKVRARFPDLNVDDPETWPEPHRCTDGAPFGPGAYGTHTSPTAWATYLHNLDEEAARRKVWNGRCRNRAKVDHLCGTHDKVRTRQREEARRSTAKRAAIERGLALAHRLGSLGVECDARGAGVLLSEEQATHLADELFADRDALLDLLGAVDELLRQPADGTPRGALAAARDRIRRHLSR
jgi:hypothetical protein